MGENTPMKGQNKAIWSVMGLVLMILIGLMVLAVTNISVPSDLCSSPATGSILVEVDVC